MIASIEAPFAFLEEPVEMIGFDAVVFPHVTLGLAPKILDPVDMNPATRKPIFGIIDSKAAIAKIDKPVISTLSIGVHSRGQIDFFPYDAWQNGP